jgi:hypothetical protein
LSRQLYRNTQITPLTISRIAQFLRGNVIGATGTVLIGTALDELERSDGQSALVTMGAAGGMAPAVIIQRM